MPKTNLQVKVSADTSWAIAWIRAMRWAAYVIGPVRAMHYAEVGARRLIRYRLDNGRWRWLRTES